jgi:hypothetical protein
MATSVTFVNMPSQGRCPAIFDGTHGFEALPTKAMAFFVNRAILPEDIANLYSSRPGVCFHNNTSPIWSSGLAIFSRCCL